MKTEEHLRLLLRHVPEEGRSYKHRLHKANCFWFCLQWKMLPKMTIPARTVFLCHSPTTNQLLHAIRLA